MTDKTKTTVNIQKPEIIYWVILNKTAWNQYKHRTGYKEHIKYEGELGLHQLLPELSCFHGGPEEDPEQVIEILSKPLF